MSKETVNLCYNDLYVQKAIQRAAHFIGIIASPANSLGIESYNIIENFQLFSHPSIEVESEILSEFRNFIINHSLREMIEAFEVTLDSAFENTAYINGASCKLKMDEIKKQINEYKRSNFPVKLDMINVLLNNKLSEQTDFWEGLKYIRNCITHDMCIVGRKTINIKIPYVRAVLKDLLTGNEYQMPLTNEGIKAPATMIPEIQIIYIDKTFNSGEIISFNYEEITYIIYTMMKYCEYFSNTILDYMELNKEYLQKFNYSIKNRTPHLAIFTKNNNDIIDISPLRQSEHDIN